MNTNTPENSIELRKKYTTDEDIAKEWVAKGIKVKTYSGHYFISRIAIPSVNIKGEKGWWYITNEGDSYTVNKASKYWRKQHEFLSFNQPEIR